MNDSTHKLAHNLFINESNMKMFVDYVLDNDMVRDERCFDFFINLFEEFKNDNKKIDVEFYDDCFDSYDFYEHSIYLIKQYSDTNTLSVCPYYNSYLLASDTKKTTIRQPCSMTETTEMNKMCEYCNLPKKNSFFTKTCDCNTFRFSRNSFLSDHITFDEYAYEWFCSIDNVKYFIKQLMEKKKTKFFEHYLRNISVIFNAYLNADKNVSFWGVCANYMKTNGFKFDYSGNVVNSVMERKIHCHQMLSHFRYYSMYMVEFKKRKWILVAFHELIYENYEHNMTNQVFADLMLVKMIYGFL